MPGVFDRVNAGQPLAGIRAESWNAMLAAAESFAQGRANQPAGPPRQWGTVEALALNSTGADLREYKPAGVTAAGGYTLSDDTPAADWNRRPLLTLGVPAADTDWVVVTLEAIPAGEIGRVAVSGVCLCDIASASSGSTRWAKATAGSTASLTASATGGTVRVLHVPSTGTPKRCAVYLHERPGTAELCEITPSVRRELIGVYVVKSGANVTDVYQRFQDVTTDANGCVSRGEPYCVVAPETCDTSREPDYYCIDGVCWAYYDGLVPGDYDAGPFATPELCDADCPFPPAGEGEFGCCTGESAATLTATISGGHGTMTLTWDGSAYWTGSKALGCGETLHLRYLASACAPDYSCDGATWLPCSASIGSATCAPFADPRTYTCDMNDTLGGCVAGSCGSLTVTVAL